MENLMINKLKTEVRYDCPYLLSEDCYLLLLNGRELLEFMGEQYNKIFEDYNIEALRYKSLWKENDIDYIVNGLVSGDWIGINSFYINILKKTDRDIVFDEENKKVIIKINSEVVLLEQYNLYLAIEKIYKLGLEIPSKFVIIVYNLGIEELNNWFLGRIKEDKTRKTKF